MFDTDRSYVGELVYQSKYAANEQSLSTLSRLVSGFVRERWLARWKVDLVTCVPPSGKGSRSDLGQR
jgi:hypothetical protein